MATPQLRVRRTGSKSLTGDHISRIQVDSRAHRAMSSHHTDDTLTKPPSKSKKAGKTASKKVAQGVGATIGKGKDAAKALSGQASAPNDEDSMADAQAGVLIAALKDAGQRGIGKANAVGNKAGKKAGKKVSSKVGRGGRPSRGRGRGKGLTGRVVGARSKRGGLHQQRAYGRAATGKAVPARMTRRALHQATRAISSLVARLVAVIVAKVSVVLLAIFVVCTLVILVLSLISSFLPAWLTGDEADNPPVAHGLGIAGVIADGLGNDYPYADRAYNTVNHATGYYFGNCTDFVIWRVNRDAGVLSEPWTYVNANTTPAGGNGFEWANPSALPGWVVVDKPTPGDIVSFAPGSQGGRWNASFGHVAYVGQVSEDGSMILENYGTGEYFQTTYTAAQMSQLVSSGEATIKHNPASKVKIKTSQGVSTVDALGLFSNQGGGPMSPTEAQATAKAMLKDYGWGDDQFQCLVNLWNGESGWNYLAENPSSGAYGIPQALPAEKMALAGPDWKTNAQTQIRWGMNYIKTRPDYGSPCAAWNLWQSRIPHWY